MDAGELLLKAHELGLRILSDGDALVIPAGFPATLRADVLRLRTTLAPLLSLEVGQLCHGMTADESETFDERAAVLEHDAGYPRELAERVAVYWTRTDASEGERRAA